MKKLISIITLAIVYISGLQQKVKELKDERDTLNSLVTDLRDKLDAENIDDEELLGRAEAAEEKYTLLSQSITDATAKGDELATLLNGEPSVPNVDPATFEITGAATQSPAAAEIQNHQEESAGGSPTSAPGAAGAPSEQNSGSQP